MKLVVVIISQEYEYRESRYVKIHLFVALRVIAREKDSVQLDFLIFCFPRGTEIYVKIRSTGLKLNYAHVIDLFSEILECLKTFWQEVTLIFINDR